MPPYCNRFTDTFKLRLPVLSIVLSRISVSCFLLHYSNCINTNVKKLSNMRLLLGVLKRLFANRLSQFFLFAEFLRFLSLLLINPNFFSSRIFLIAFAVTAFIFAVAVFRI